jgi:hypothetical protein
MTKPSKFDNDTFLPAREHLNTFIKRTAENIGFAGQKLLEIGPQERSEVKSNFSMCNIETLDIVPNYNPDIIGDLTKYNSHIEDSTYDIIEIDKLETPDRNLFPIKYNILAKCNKLKNVDIHSIKFEPIN